MHFTVYKITNIINNKIYIGVHQTDNINDDYYGSGINIKRAIVKYGINNFNKEILFDFDNKEDMFEKEKELVTENFILDKNNYNINIGGYGGWSNEMSIKGGIASGNRNVVEKLGYFSEENIENNKKRVNSKEWKLYVKKQLQPKAVLAAQTFEAKEKRKKTRKLTNFQQGKNNSQYGTIWITNGINSKKIKKESPIPENWRRGQTKKRG